MKKKIPSQKESSDGLKNHTYKILRANTATDSRMKELLARIRFPLQTAK